MKCAGDGNKRKTHSAFPGLSLCLAGLSSPCHTAIWLCMFSTFLFFKVMLVVLCLLHFQIHFRTNFAFSNKKPAGILVGMH